MRPIALCIVTVLAVSAAACSETPEPVTLRPPTPREVPSATPDSTPFGDATVATADCGEAVAETTDPQPLQAEAPERPNVPGVGQPGDDELNEGVELITPIDPDAVIEPDAGLEEPTIVPPGAQGDPQPHDVVTHRPVTTVSSQVGHIAEPNVAISGSSWLMTWNWGAARSFDGGNSVHFLNPWVEMQGPDGIAVDGGFCCDQLAHHVPHHDLWLWVLQSRTLNRNYSGGNRIRIAIARGNGDFDRHLDFLSSGAGLPDDAWFDQPKIGVSDGHMFLSVNAYGPEPKPFIASVVYRVALAELAVGDYRKPVCFTTLDLHGRSGNRPLFAPVPVRHARDTMYLGAHYSNSELAVWRWPDGSSQPTIHLASDLTADGQPAGYPVPTRTDDQGNAVYDYRCPPEGTYDRKTDWCQRSSDRISTAWLAKGRLGFAWNVGQDQASGWNYPSVFVRIIDEARLTTCALGGCVVAKPNIRHRDVAYQYAAIGPNGRGDLGLVAIFGGGRYRPSCHYAIRASADGDAAGWDWSKESLASSFNAFEPEFGDYLNIWPGPTDASWTAACMTLQTSNEDTPGAAHFLTFGRRADQPTH